MRTMRPHRLADASPARGRTLGARSPPRVVARPAQHFPSRDQPMVHGRKSDPRRIRLLARLRSEGLTLAQIAKQVGISRQAVHTALRRQALRGGPAICRHCGATIPGTEGAGHLHNLLCRECLAKFPLISLAVRIVSLRIMAGLTQAELAQATGFSQPLISKVEKDKQQPRRQTRLRLLTFLESAVVNRQRN